MRGSRALRAAAVVVLCAGLTPSFPPAIAAAATPTTAAAQVEDQVQALLWPLIQKIQAYAGDRFGGAYMDGDSRSVVVNVVNAAAADSTAITALATAVTLPEPIRVVDVGISEDALQALSDGLYKSLDTVLPPDDSFSVGPQVQDQSIFVQVLASDLSAATEIVSQFQSQHAGVDVHVSTLSEPIVMMACTQFAECDPPLRGGTAFYGFSANAKIPMGLCTAGFIAHSYTDSKWYVMTAGHCVNPASNPQIHIPLYQENIPHLGDLHKVGPTHSTTYQSGGDAALVEISNPDPVTGWNPKNWVIVYNGPGYDGAAPPTQDFAYGIGAVSGNAVGMRVCKTGSQSFSNCGKVKHTGVTYKGCDNNNQNCHTIYHGAIASICAIEGDSGSPIFAVNNAYGIVSAAENKSGKCVASGSYETWYVGAVGAQNDLNAYIVL